MGAGGLYWDMPFLFGMCLWVSKTEKSLVLEKVAQLYGCVGPEKGFPNFSHGQSDLTTKSYYFIMQSMHAAYNAVYMLQCYSIHISSLSLLIVITGS